MPSSDIAFCLAEDRAEAETGVRLAILSLARHCPATPVYVYRPPSDPTFGEWLREFPQVNWIPHVPAGANSWNCKPQALKPLLAEGYRNVVWLDSDILLTRDCRSLFLDSDENTLVIAQEPASLPCQGTGARTRAWNLEARRALPFTLNSSVVGVTARHLALLQRWAEFLADPQYLACQAMVLEERPIHMAGDQDVINALIGAPEFADIPLRVVPSAVDIIHCGGALGYSWLERLRGMWKPKPTFFHATAGKPWLWFNGEPYWSQRNFFSWHRRLLQELSPYVFEARSYRGQLREDTRWMDHHTATGLFLRLLGFGNFALRGLPLAMAASAMDAVKNLRRPRAAQPIGQPTAGQPADEAAPVLERRQR